MDILRVKDELGRWIDIPAIVGPQGAKGTKGDKGDKGDTGTKGDTGPRGYKGDTGASGYSPTVSVTPISGGNMVIITDQNGPKIFNVMNGVPGPGISFHICSVSEYDATTRKPTISNPETNVFYLVPGEDASDPDLFVEWIYANNAWEMFGSASIDLSGYATKADTVLDTTLSRGRAANTTVGQMSFAFGYNVEASGVRSNATGSDTHATGNDSHAEGYSATAEGSYTHAEGVATLAKGNASHAEGLDTIANGPNAHAEGVHTVANGNAAHAGGWYNVPDSYASWPEWVSGTNYAVGDKAKITDENSVVGYVCTTPNSDETFARSKWSQDSRMNFIETIGNGTSDNARSNARALDWDGNERLKGNVYVGCNADSSGGTRLPHDVQVNGVSVVQNGVAYVPTASKSVAGVLKLSADSNIKAGTEPLRAITPLNQHAATFYGLAKAAGDSTQSASSNAVGTYTETARSKISDMLNAPVSVSGSTPSITAMAGVRYICGEVSTLAVTVPASGCIDVMFESGSTATVLTVTSAKSGVTVVKWANGWDGTCEANTTYEINILDGEFGVIAAWT